MPMDYELLFCQGTTAEREERIRTLFDIIGLGIVILNQDHRVVETNQHFADMLGYSKAEMLQLHSWDWEANMSEADIRTEFADMTKIKTSFISRHRRKDGSIYDVEVTAAGTSINGENMILCICWDISQRIEAEKQLKYVSTHDELTGLANRMMFEQTLQEFACNECYPVSILSCDLNNLKQINDTHGHLVGDEYLIEAARILENATKQKGVVARLGGDEFAIFLPSSDQTTAKNICFDILQQMQNYNHRLEQTQLFPLSISIGQATALDPVDDLWQIYREADHQMLRFKRKTKQATSQAEPIHDCCDTQDS